MVYASSQAHLFIAMSINYGRHFVIKLNDGNLDEMPITELLQFVCS